MAMVPLVRVLVDARGLDQRDRPSVDLWRGHCAAAVGEAAAVLVALEVVHAAGARVDEKVEPSARRVGDAVAESTSAAPMSIGPPTTRAFACSTSTTPVPSGTSSNCASRTSGRGVR
jgi:hypothetical protein